MHFTFRVSQIPKNTPKNDSYFPSFHYTYLSDISTCCAQTNKRTNEKKTKINATSTIISKKRKQTTTRDDRRRSFEEKKLEGKRSAAILLAKNRPVFGLAPVVHDGVDAVFTLSHRRDRLDDFRGENTESTL